MSDPRVLGTVTAVNTTNLGGVLASDHPAGASALTVEDAADFSEDGGQLLLAGQVLGYDTVDDAAAAITLTAPLTSAASEGDRVDVYDPERGEAAVESVAQVAAEGAEFSDDPLEATVEHALVGYLPEGIRSSVGEMVELVERGDSLYVANVLTRSPSLDGQTVWNPYAAGQMSAVTVADNTWRKITSWAGVETNAVALTSGSWVAEVGGWYYVQAQAAFEPQATGHRRVRVVVNGAETVYNAVPADNSPTFSTFVGASRELRLVEGDVLDVEVRQSSGAGLALSDGLAHNHFAMHRISI